MTLFTPAKLGKRFNIANKEVKQLTQEFKPRYNAAPSQIMPVVVEPAKQRHLQLMRWGFLPSWSKDPRDTFKYSTFNTRAEDVFNKPTWKRAILSSRCLVPANGFYEWVKTPTGRQPYFIRPKNEPLFAFAGIYNVWHDSEGKGWGTYSIITTAPNKEMKKIHNRMPLILRPQQEERWLKPTNNTADSIIDILHPYSDGTLEIYEVSRDVNTAREDNPTLIEPVHQ